MKKILIILNDTNKGRVVADNIEGYYRTSLTSDSDDFKLFLILKGRKEHEIFYYASGDMLEKEVVFLDTFFEAVDISQIKERSRLDSLV